MSLHVRAGAAQLLSEFIATFGLLAVIWFMATQFAGATAATVLFRWLIPSLPKNAASVVVPHPARQFVHER